MLLTLDGTRGMSFVWSKCCRVYDDAPVKYLRVWDHFPFSCVSATQTKTAMDLLATTAARLLTVPPAPRQTRTKKARIRMRRRRKRTTWSPNPRWRCDLFWSNGHFKIGWSHYWTDEINISCSTEVRAQKGWRKLKNNACQLACPVKDGN